MKFLEHNSCTGCGACENACPVDCISMKMDNEKFYYPIIDEDRCINCNKCESVCPVIKNKERNDDIKPKAYAIVNNDEQTRFESSSGGFFSMLAEHVLYKGGVVFGVALLNDCRTVSHIAVESVDELYKLRGSKYVQSSVGKSYQKVKRFLEEGREVLFTGTPCQIEGLKGFLGREYLKLLTVDLICHGVPSQYAWNRYLDCKVRRFGNKVEEAYFRNKRNGWHRFSMVLKFADGKVYSKDLHKDEWLKAFLNNIYLRPSCHTCSFKTLDRKSDFTMADLWGINKICSEWDDDKGVSLLLVHSSKGADIINVLKEECRIREVNIDVAIMSNKMAVKSVVAHVDRERFVCDIDKVEFDKLVCKYIKTPSALKRLLGKVVRKISLK